MYILYYINYIYIIVYIYGRLVITGFTRLDPLRNQSVCLLGLLTRRSFDFTAGRILVFYATKRPYVVSFRNQRLCATSERWARNL